MPKCFQLLKCEFDGSARGWAKEYRKRFLGLGHYPLGWSPGSGRERDIEACIGMMALFHLGYAIPVRPRQLLNLGVDVVVDYFTGDWWQEDRDARHYFNKSKMDSYFTWYDMFSKGLLLCLLSQRWSDVAKVCSWLEAKCHAKYYHEDVEEEVVHLYKSFAASLRPEPMPGLDKVEKKIAQARSVRPKLLFEAWLAARARDQAAFDAAFIKSVKHFHAHYGTGPIAVDWIATHQSVLALTAQRLGMTIPELPPELEARIITPRSLGFATRRK